MTTPQELVEPFRRKLKQRMEEIWQKERTVETTPEDHGEYGACNYVSFELSIRLRKQDSGTISENWEQAFLNHLRETPDPQNRAEVAENMFERAFADELEQIWKQAGIM